MMCVAATARNRRSKRHWTKKDWRMFLTRHRVVGTPAKPAVKKGKK